MDHQELRRRLLVTFASELEEHVETLNTELLALEGERVAAQRPVRVRNLFRAAHSLKGAANAVGLEPIGSACHLLEDLFGAVRDGPVKLPRATFQLLFNVVDGIADAGRRARSGGDLERSPLTRLLPQLAQAVRQPAAENEPDAGEPTAADIPSADVAEPVAPAVADPRSVRVAVDKLDALVAWNGELLVARGRLGARQGDADRLIDAVRPCLDDWRALRRSLKPGGTAAASDLAAQLDALGNDLERIGRLAASLSARIRTDNLAIEQAAAPLDDIVRSTRMLPFASACQGLERTVRDLARAQEKQVELVIEGGDVELDRDVLGRLRDPLLHLVRNAVDHGVELPADRRQAGKPARARIRVAAALVSGRVEIVVEDDGRGLDVDAARRRARAMDIDVPDDGSAALADIVFLPGVSTARTVTDVSGRGIGLDIVKSEVEAQRGTVDVSFEPGRGTRFAITVPLTLGVVRALLVTDAGTTYAVDDAGIDALRRITAADIHSIEGRQVLSLDGGHVPIMRLGEVLGIAGGKPRTESSRQHVMVLKAGERRVALVVDELVAEDDVTVKPLGPRLAGARHVVGATVLPDGGVALILDPRSLVVAALAAAPSRSLADVSATEVAARPRQLLLVDDSITVRTLEKSILEAAGYAVVAVADGMEAWQLLQELDVDLLVSDVEMPRMDGIALTERVRASPRLRELPVILVTALKDERDRMRGLEAGADAYVVKSAFDQVELLATIERLTGGPTA